MSFNENSRVKIPTILHLCSLGFEYLPLSKAKWDPTANIFTDIFYKSMKKLNPNMEEADFRILLDSINLSLDNEDLGKSFYEILTNTSGHTLIDFQNFKNNTLNVVTELPCINGDEEFRPDITILVNGLPLVFIEVKKPNNLDGIQAEYKRIQSRFKNKKFRKFINITQLMVFSNNMEYTDDGSQPLQGAFYATTAYGDVKFNYFREENAFNLAELLIPISEETETDILKDNNLVSIKNSQEFLTNKLPSTPTNRICTSLFQPERLSFMLQYGIAYVKSDNGLEKHVMRYPQIFATKAIERKLNEGIKKGIIWHTQGSGKTALAYYNVKYLTHYFRDQNVVPKFYFIVDRLDLLIQAGREFKSRGLVVHKINSRDEFVRDLKKTTALHNSSGKPEISVVNIQKFKEDRDVVSRNDYQINIQRIYFLDEVHRSYNPKGSFLANLNESDTNAIKIGLTGTPLLGNDYNSKSLFGDYIHKYYYNASIADGYTLRLIREEIETSYKFKLKQALEEIDILKGEGDRKVVYAHPKFVEPLLDYIINDFEKSRITMNDSSIGAMVICDSSEQAEKLKEIFDAKYAIQHLPTMAMVAEPGVSYNSVQKELCKVHSSALILHDAGTKDDREILIEDFKAGKIDFLFVYNMLLTGFDAPRLKKLYVTRIIKAHNLLQALTRVNRTYKNFKYGYVVDFADIQREFDKTNRDYFNELQNELGDEMQHYTNLFKSKEEIEEDIRTIKDVLFRYDTANAEVFSQQISKISDKKMMLELTKALNNAKDLYNLIRLSGHYEMLEKLDFQKITLLAREANNHLALINTKEALENNLDTTNLLNVALEDVVFAFTKLKQEEMIIADQLKNTLQKTREMLGSNFDQRDPIFITLKEELERLFKKKNLSEVSKEEMEANIKELEKIYDEAKELERKNQLLKAKYDNDSKYARLHKRLIEKDPLTDSESKLFEALQSLKKEVDAQILKNAHVLENESFVEKMILRLVISQLKNKYDLPLDADRSQAINHLIVKEYLNEYNGRVVLKLLTMSKKNEIKLFEQKQVRTIWESEQEKWYISIIDVIAVLTESPNPRKYWSVLKTRLKAEGSQLATNCSQLKMQSADGKFYLTDVADTEQIFRLIQSIPSPKAEPFKLWLAEVGSQRIDEMQDPELSIDRALGQYMKLGYSQKWINQRLKSIEIRKELTDEWKKRGLKEGAQFAILTDIITKAWSEKSTKEYKILKGLKKENLRDNMTNTELILSMLAEASTKDISEANKPKTFEASKKVAKQGGNVAKVALKELESKTGKKVVSSLNAKNLLGIKDTPNLKKISTSKKKK